MFCCCRREVKQKTAEAKSTGSKAVLSGGKTSRPCNMDAVSEANDTFALSLLKMLCEDDASGNVFFSPLSISSALAMVFLGAKGNTAAQMSQVFSLNTEKDVHVGFQSLLAEMNKPSTQYLLRSANRIFAEKTCEFFSTFKELCLRSCNAELEQLPFAKDAEKSRKHINTWVSEMTEGKIQNLLPANSIDEDTRLIVVNAVYFKGRWSEPFKKTCTKEMPFKINQKEQRPVQMMVQNATFNLAYIEEVKAQVLELPYEGKELSMLILLPDHNVDLSLVEKELTLEKLIAWTKPNRMWRTEVEVFLPRFKLEEHYAMESVLQRLGIVDAFQVDKADFSAMSAEKDLCLSKFVHKAFVEVNEEGTEAAAATLSLIVWGCAQYVRKMFCADHPFLFFIRHNKANCILFCGKFSSP